MLIVNKITIPPDKGILLLFKKDLWNEFFVSNKKFLFIKKKFIITDDSNVKNITYVSNILF